MADLAYIRTLLAGQGYQVMEVISSGSFAVVRKAKSEAFNKIVAVKLIDKTKAPRDFLDKFLPRELEIAKQLNHVNIIETLQVLQLGWFTIVAMEMAEIDLLSVITKKGPLSEKRAQPVLIGILDGLHFMHEKQIAHRDIKCENILLNSEGVIKIADFGFSRYIVDPVTKKRMLSDTFCGSAAYAAPEILRGCKYNPIISDVWSVGVVLYIMVNGIMPFDDTNHVKLLRDQLERRWSWHPDRKHMFSIEMRRVVRGILEPDVTNRLSITRIRNSMWLNKKNSNEKLKNYKDWLCTS